MKLFKFKLIAFTAVSAFMLSATTTVQAQTDDASVKIGEFGIRYMPTFVKIDLRDSKGAEIPGAVSIQQGFGIMLGFNFSTHVGIQGEINYSQLSQKYKDADINRELKIRYVNIPLLLSLNTSKSQQFNLNFVAGPEFGFNTGAEVNTNGSNGNDTLKAVVVLKKGNVGFAYGTGLEIAVNQSRSLRFDLGYRGYYSFVDVTTTTKSSDSYNVIVNVPKARHGAYIGFTVQF